MYKNSKNLYMRLSKMKDKKIRNTQSPIQYLKINIPSKEGDVGLTILSSALLYIIYNIFLDMSIEVMNE